MKPESRTPEASLDTTLEALADRRRRLVIEYIASEISGESASLEELAKYVSAQETNGRCYEETKQNLYHISLPKLDEAGLIDYDTGNKSIRLRSENVDDVLLAYVNTVEKRKRVAGCDS